MGERLTLPRLGGHRDKVGHQQRERIVNKRRTRRRFTAEYKSEAVKRLEESGKSLQHVADELGVHANQLRTWRNEILAAGTAEAVARQKAETAELARLRREVKRLEQENEILKKAAAFFAREAVPS